MSQPRALRRRLTAGQLEQLADEYRAGSVPAELAKRYGVARSSLVLLLHEQGLAIRTQSLTAEQREEAKRLRVVGYTYVALGEHFGMHKSTVWHAVNPTNHAY